MKHKRGERERERGEIDAIRYAIREVPLSVFLLFPASIISHTAFFVEIIIIRLPVSVR